MRRGYVTAPVLGALWCFVIAVTVAVAMSFATGAAFRPAILLSLLLGAGLGVAALHGAMALWNNELRLLVHLWVRLKYCLPTSHQLT